jgi:4-hydroxybenzoate-CoA ligase
MKLHNELKNHVKSTLSHYNYPRWIDFVDDLPKTATGKIKRFELKEQTEKVTASVAA